MVDFSKFRVKDKRNNAYLDTKHIAIGCGGRYLIFLEKTYTKVDSSRYQIDYFLGIKDVNGVELYENDWVIDSKGREIRLNFDLVTSGTFGYVGICATGLDQPDVFFFNADQKVTKVKDDVRREG